MARDAIAFHDAGFAAQVDGLLPNNGLYAFRKDGEKHAWNPETISTLQLATRLGSYKKFKEFTSLVDRKEAPIFLRDFLDFRRAPISIDKVEPVESIMHRFVTGAMSYGSISKEAHEAMAIAMNRIHGRSNTGEGGEDSARFTPREDGTSLRSAIKQVASGRFGVTTEYLVNADEIQIKVAQGAKPGEGGQLPGFKVDQVIAKTRHSIPGISLISPPPHHDIYSIEDLAQLIDRKIVVYSRETSSGTYEFFKESVLKNKNYMSSSLSMPATGAIIQSVSQTKGAIGYVGLAYLSPRVKSLSVSYDGKHFAPPTMESATDKSYPIVRPLYYYYNTENAGQVNPLISFILSPAGQEIIKKSGYIPVK